MTLVSPSRNTVSIGTVQPSVIVGVGEFGHDVCVELEKRRRQRDRFSRNVSYHEKAVIKFVDLAIQQNEISDIYLSLDYNEFLREDIVEKVNSNVPDYCAVIGNALQKATATRAQPTALWLTPCIYLVVSINEPLGSAALWPLAIAIRALLPEQEFQLIAVVDMANLGRDVDSRIRADSLAFDALEEGRFLAAQGAGGAVEAQEFSAESVKDPDDNFTDSYLSRSSPFPFDTFYLFDSVKENNSTVYPRLDVGYSEGVANISNFIEANTLSDLPLHVDSWLLGDYLPAIDGKMYVATAGTSSLAVPLDTLWTEVSNEATARLILEHLCALPAEEEQRVRSKAMDRVRNIEIALEDKLRECLQKEGAISVGQQSDEGERIDADILFEGPARIPSIKRFRPHGGWPKLEILSVNAIRQLLRDEQRILDRMARGAGRRVDDDIRGTRVAKFQPMLHEVALNLLNTDEQGLVTASAFARGALQKSDSLRAEIQFWHDNRSGSPHSLQRRLLQWAMAATRGVSATARIERLARWISYPSSLALRALVAGIVLHQFYWDGYLREQLFWPFVELNNVNWSFILRALIVAIISFVLLLGGLPLLALQLERKIRRTIGTVAAREQVQRAYRAAQLQFWNDLTRHLREMLQLLEEQLTTLEERGNTLLDRLPSKIARTTSEAFSDFTQWESGFQEEVLPETYLERMVTDIQQLKGEQDVHPALELFLPGFANFKWYEGGEKSGSLEPTSFISADEVEQLVLRIIDPIMSERVTSHDVDHYLARDEKAEELTQLAFTSAVPWLRFAEVNSMNGRSAIPSNLFVSAAVSPNGSDSPWVQFLGGTSGLAAAKGLDRFRATLIQYRFGIGINELNRYSTLRFHDHLYKEADHTFAGEAVTEQHKTTDGGTVSPITTPMPDPATVKATPEVTPASSSPSSDNASSTPPPSDTFQISEVEPEVFDFDALLDRIEVRDNTRRGYRYATEQGSAEEIKQYEEEVDVLDEWLLTQGVEIIYTEPGTLVNVYLHEAVGAVHDETVPPMHIVSVERDAYRLPPESLNETKGGFYRSPNGSWVRPARVIGSKGPKL